MRTRTPAKRPQYKEAQLTLEEAEHLLLKKEMFFEPCTTKEELKEFLLLFLKMDLPDFQVDELSTSTPMDFIWEVYYTMLTNEGPFRHAAAAARGTAKTLVSATIEFLCMIHFRRDTVHTSALKQQSKKALKYMNKFCNIDVLRQYFKTESTFELELVDLPPNSYTTKNDARLVSVAATIQGVNGERSNCVASTSEIVMKNMKSGAGTVYSKKATVRVSAEALFKKIQNNEEVFLQTLNEQTCQVEFKRCIAGQRSLQLDRVAIYISKSIVPLIVTPEHPVAVEYDGAVIYKQAQFLKEGDSVLCQNLGASLLDRKNTKEIKPGALEFPYSPLPKFSFNEFSDMDIVYGHMLGDGCIFARKHKSGRPDLVIPFESRRGKFIMTKTPRVESYCIALGEEMISRNIIEKFYINKAKSGYTGEDLTSFDCKANDLTSELYRKWYCPVTRKKILPLDLKITYPMLALLIADDGSTDLRSIATYSFTVEENERIRDQINELLGYDAASVRFTSRVDKKTQKQKTYPSILLKFGIQHMDKFEKIARFLPEEYRYKIHRKPLDCTVCKKPFYFSTVTHTCHACKANVSVQQNTVGKEVITKINTFREKPTVRARWVYDFQLEDNHNFFVNRFLVHNCLVFDELDLVKRDVISEAAMQQTPTLCGHSFEPVTIYLSSRKTNDGPVQDIIEEAEAGSTSIRLHKYSMVDWMQKCPEEVHGAHGLKFWIHKDSLKVVFDKLPSTELAASYIERTGYEGCRTCPALVVCQGRSPKQQSTSRFLKSRQFVASQIQDVKDPKKIIAQILNWRPESTGIVFDNFSRSLHSSDASGVHEWMFNEDAPEIVSKDTIYAKAVAEGWTCTFGVDWGYQDPAVVVVVLYHRKHDRCVLLHVRSATGNSNSTWATTIVEYEAKRFPPAMICPDMADAASPTYFRKHKLPCRDKKPARIETGVSQLRGLMFDPNTQKSQFMVLNEDDQSEWAIKHLLKWKHSMTVTGGVDFNSFEDSEFTHVPDSVRYAIDMFLKKDNIAFATSQISQREDAARRAKTAADEIPEWQRQYAKMLSQEHGIQNPFVNAQEIPRAVSLNSAYVEDPVQAKKRLRQSGGMAIKF